MQRSAVRCASYIAVLPESSYQRENLLARRRRKRRIRQKTIHDFITHQFHTLAMTLAHTGGLDSFGINQKQQESPRKANDTFFVEIHVLVCDV